MPRTIEASGRSIDEAIFKGLKELDQKLTAGISDEEMQVFFYVTDKMLDNLAK